MRSLGGLISMLELAKAINTQNLVINYNTEGNFLFSKEIKCYLYLQE